MKQKERSESIVERKDTPSPKGGQASANLAVNAREYEYRKVSVGGGHLKSEEPRASSQSSITLPSKISRAT